MSEYQYKPLGGQSIRILELLPGKLDESLKGYIKHRAFCPKRHRQIPIFEALSYAWGSQDDRETLSIIDNPTKPESSLRIGKNLAAALRDLRSKFKSRIIWCDAVCINQQDLLERAAQVQRMADIYRHANRVVVWLAPENDRISRALHILDEIGSHVGLDINGTRLYTHRGMDSTYLGPDYLVPLTTHDWQCVIDLVSLPWFTRLWVRQEIALANASAVLTAGTHEMLWSRFCSAIRYLAWKLDWEETVLKAAQRPSTTTISGNATNLIECQDLANDSLDVITLTDGCQYTDPRDRIYGVLGLQTALDIPIDYGKTVREVYTDWALGYYKHYSRLGFLEMCEMASKPSWVPNLAKPMNLQLGRTTGRSAANTKAVLEIIPGQLCKMLATRCGTVTQQTSAIPQCPGLEVFQNIFKSWICQFFPRGIQSRNGLAIDDLAAAVSGGRAKEQYKNGRFTMLNVKKALLQGNEKFCPSISKQRPVAPRLLAELTKLLSGAAVFATNNDHFGLGSSAARVGDEIFVVLGCRHPIVMRRAEDLKYRVVGPCYIPQLSHGEAILGPVPNEWKMMFDINGNPYFLAPDRSHTLEDPRLERELPPGWDQNEKDGYLRWARCDGDKWRKFDPRQTPDKLKARGLKLEMITVI